VSVCPISRIQSRTHRLIASRYPTIGIFDSVASHEDATEAMALEQLTNDRLTVPLESLRLLDPEEVVVGHGASIVMAAFIHASESGGRFTDRRLGAWYCSLQLETAIDETVHHHTRRLAVSEAGFRQTIQMRELVVELSDEFHDVRGLQIQRSELYLADDYSHAQALGSHLRESGSKGICYDSVRRSGGSNLVVYKPRLLIGHQQGDHFEYQWTGSPTPMVTKLTNVDRG
jgi:RES domain-containing protein